MACVTLSYYDRNYRQKQIKGAEFHTNKETTLKSLFFRIMCLGKNLSKF